MEAENKSRFAEIAAELMGAQALKGLLDKVWDEASPAARQQLADAVLAAFQAKYMFKDSYVLSHAAETFVMKETEKILADPDFKLPSDFKAAVLATVERSWKSSVDRAADSMLEALRHNLATEVSRILRR